MFPWKSPWKIWAVIKSHSGRSLLITSFQPPLVYCFVYLVRWLHILRSTCLIVAYYWIIYYISDGGGGGGGRGLANIYPKGSLFGLGVILEIILVPSLGRYGADMVVLDFLPCDECTVTPGKFHLSSLYEDSNMLRKHQTTQFLPLHRGVQSQCMHTHSGTTQG